MKNSNIKIYVEDAELPRYESEGASGFDLRAKFTSNAPYLTLEFIENFVQYGITSDLNRLYNQMYGYEQFPVLDSIEFYHVIHRIINKLYNLKKEDGSFYVNLLEYMKHYNIPAVNIILPYKSIIFPTNLYMEIPEEDELQIRPRSGISSKTLLQVSLGTVDSDYRGNVGIIIQNPSPIGYAILPNERLAQGVIVSKKHAVFIEMDSKDKLNKTERGEKGMGSTGTK